jgi:TRAP-type C4-dicarboxylate transport system substrate-binding protein
MKPTRHFWQLALAAALLTTAIACSDDSPETKAADNPGPVTLRLGTADDSERPGGVAITEFVRQVRTLSGGQLLIYPVWEASGTDVHDWDQLVARMVTTSQLDLGMIPTRAWDTEGVTSLRAVNAPFLVTSDALADKIATTTDLTGDMMKGLDKAGVTGLALMPEGLRHPFGFGHALVAPGDFSGKKIRAARSDLGDATLRALGGTPEDTVGDAFSDGVQTGRLGGAETGFVLSGSLPAPGIATTNVTFQTKINSLVINSKVLSGLSPANQATLQNAATATLQWVLGHRTTEADNAAAFCNRGGKIVTATDANLRALTQAVQPVYAQLEQDPDTKQMIERIRQLKKTVQVPTKGIAAPCP